MCCTDCIRPWVSEDERVLDEAQSRAIIGVEYLIMAPDRINKELPVGSVVLYNYSILKYSVLISCKQFSPY